MSPIPLLLMMCHSQTYLPMVKVQAMIDSEITSSNDETLAKTGHSGSIANLPQGLYTKILERGDRLVMMAEQLIDNETSNLAECYMSSFVL